MSKYERKQLNHNSMSSKRKIVSLTEVHPRVNLLLPTEMLKKVVGEYIGGSGIHLRYSKDINFCKKVTKITDVINTDETIAYAVQYGLDTSRICAAMVAMPIVSKKRLAWARAKFGCDVQELFGVAAASGNLGLIQELNKREKHPLPTTIYRAAAKNGHIRVINYGFQRFQRHVRGSFNIYDDVTINNERFGFKEVDDILAAACANGHLSVVLWLHEKGLKLIVPTIAQAYHDYGHASIIEHLGNTGLVPQLIYRTYYKKVLRGAIKYNHSTILHLYDGVFSSGPFNDESCLGEEWAKEEMIRNCGIFDNVDAVMWALGQGWVLSDQWRPGTATKYEILRDTAIQYKSVKVLAFLRERGVIPAETLI
jgi:hypothetical protein